MKIHCPNPLCHAHQHPRLKVNIHKLGYYYRRSDSQTISRYRCCLCRRCFSTSTFFPSYRQQKRQINSKVRHLLCSGVSQRRTALLLGVNPKTVVRKFRYLATLASMKEPHLLHQLQPQHLSLIQFDDLETSIHSKCKPASVSIAIEPKTRRILSFQVSLMPAKGHLAKIARQKYGYQKDERPHGWKRLMKSINEILSHEAQIHSDENPHYPVMIRRHLKCVREKKIEHVTFPGKRGCVVGQGELKKIGFDPLFSLNHTCAMLRANMNRLFRRTWCTSKTLQGLIDHLWIYMEYHNRRLGLLPIESAQSV